MQPAGERKQANARAQTERSGGQRPFVKQGRPNGADGGRTHMVTTQYGGMNAGKTGAQKERRYPARPSTRRSDSS